MNTLEKAVASFVGGDESAFNDIYSATHRKVSLVACTYLKNQADAEDAVQDIYLNVYKKLYTIQDAGKAMSWILALTRNTCLNKLEKNKRTETTLSFDEEDLPSVFTIMKDERVYDSPEQNLLAREEDEIIDDILSILPLEQRDAVLLHHIEQRSVEEVAEITDVAVGTIKSRLNYARHRLRRYAFRIKKDIPAQIQLLGDCPFHHEWDKEVDPVTIKNISMSGLMFLSGKEYRKEDKLSVLFFLEPKELYPEPIKIALRVVRNRQYGGINEVGAFFLGEEVNECLSRYIVHNLTDI